MVYRFNNIRTDLGFGTMPEESIEYSRKGGCFISLCRGVCISFFLLFFITLLLVIVFFSTRHAYEKQAGVILEEFVRKPSPFIDKTDRLAKLFTPKNYRLIIYSSFNTTYETNPSFEGVVWIVFVARRGNIRKIELNIKNLNIREDDVIVYKSFKVPNLRNLSQTYMENTNYLNLRDSRYKREDVTDGDTDDVSSVTTDENETVTSDGDESTIDLRSMSTTISTSTPTLSSTTPCKKHDDEEDDLDDDVTMKKINQVYIDEDDELMIISLDVELRRNIFYTVKVDFQGNMTNDKGLFYKLFGENTKNPSFLSGTFTTPESARMILPCFDDDDFQSVFDISIIRPEDVQSASNAKLNTTESIINSDNLVIDHYYPTPPMPASELGFIVTNIKSFELEMNRNLSLQLFTQENNILKVNKTMLAIQYVVNIIENYTGVPFNMDELSYVILPHRQNYREIKRGIILTSEYYIPISTDAYLSNREITNELAFQWFDGINQYELYEEIWLKKAFPLFLQQIALNDKDESDYYEAEYLVFKSKVMQDEMDYSNFRLTREIDEDRLNQDTMNFMQKKGLCILKMFNYTLSTNVFQEAIAEYFKKRTHNQTVAFYSTLQAAANKENFSSSIDINHVFGQWITYDQVPMLTLQKVGNKFILKQKLFSFEDHQLKDTHRTISVTYKDPHENCDKIYWLTKREYIFRKMENNSFLILNPSGNGYYRSNYHEDLWYVILKELRKNYTNFSSFTRATLIDDAYNLARYGLVKYNMVFHLTSIVMNLEQSYLPWKILLNNFDYLYRNMPDLPIFYSVLEYFEAGIEKANINDSALTSDNPNEVKDTDDLMILLEKWSCKLGLVDCVSKKRDQFETILNGNLFPEIQNTEDDLYTILCTVIKYGGIDEWNRVYSKFVEASNHFSSSLVKSLGCTREPALISKYVNFLLNEDLVWKLHHTDIITSISENQIMLKYAMEYLHIHWLELMELHKLQDFVIIFKRLSSDKDFKILQTLFTKYSVNFMDHDKPIFRNILHSIKTTLKWKDKFAVKINNEMLNIDNTDI